MERMNLSKKGLIISAAVVAALLIAGIVTYFVFKNGDDLTNSKNAPSSSSPADTAPATDEARNNAAQQAIDAGQAAMNNGDKAEAQKQFESAEKLYVEAGNADGVETVKGFYPLLENMPERTTPTDATQSQ